MGIVTGSTNWNGQDNFFDFVQFAAEKVGMTREEYMAIHGIGNAIKENSNIKTFAAFNESQLNEKKITVDWNDDENSLVFSDEGLTKVDYDGEFQYRGKWFSTADHNGPEDLIKDLTKAFKGDKFIYVNESKTSDEAAKAIDKAITKIDSSMSTVDFAMAVGKILREEYGKHNFDSFMEVLHKDLGI